MRIIYIDKLLKVFKTVEVMDLVKAISANKLLAFVTGTVIVQSLVVGTAIYLRSSEVKEQTALNYSVVSNYGAVNPVQDPAVVQDPDAEKTAAVAGGQEAESQPRQVTYKVSAGDTLTKIWVKNGANSGGGLSAADAFKKAGVSLGSLRLNEEILLTISADGDIIEFRKKIGQGKVLILRGDSANGYRHEVIESPIVEKERVVTYPIFNSFSVSAREISVPNEIIDELVDLFSGRIDFRRDIQPGDTFTVIYSERSTADGEVLPPGPIRAVSFENRGRLMAAIRHVGQDGKGVYFNEKGEMIGNYFLRYPVKFSRISSVFSTARFHPVLKTSRPHNGVDFAAPVGTPVRTVADGVVEYAGYSSGGGGIMIKIRHCDRYTTAYLHLSKITPSVKKGSRVSRGQVIGAVGMTGLATGPHLHFSLYDNDVFTDPLKANLPSISQGGNSIPGLYLASTMQKLQRQHDIIRIAAAFGRPRESKV